MKKFLLLFSFLAVSFVSFGQVNRTYVTETLDTITNADTITRETMEFSYPFDYAFHIIADSLSGSTAGTITFYHKPKEASSTEYISIGTVTINGVQTTSKAITGNYMSGRIKYEVITSGTQSTRLKIFAEVKKEN